LASRSLRAGLDRRGAQGPLPFDDLFRLGLVGAGSRTPDTLPSLALSAAEAPRVGRGWAGGPFPAVRIPWRVAQPERR
jgi:hypothetical protein